MSQMTMPLDNGKKTMGRQRRENRLVRNKESRQVTFSKRKAGLWKKAAELVVLCRARIAIVVFSESGKAFAFGSPSARVVLGDVDGGPVPDASATATATAEEVDWDALEAMFVETAKKGKEVTAEAERMSAIGKKIVEVQTQGGKQSWWETDVEALGEAELPVFAKALERIMDNVGRRVDKLRSTPQPQ